MQELNSVIRNTKRCWGVVLVSFLMIIACGEEEGEKDIVGTWKIESIEDVEGNNMLAYMDETFTVELKDDGTFIRDESIIEVEGSWELTDKELIFTDESGGAERKTTGLLVEITEDKIIYTTGEGETKLTVHLKKIDN